nr:MAG TPA: hypothetical protein [Caudoviricetes sp.]
MVTKTFGWCRENDKLGGINGNNNKNHEWLNYNNSCFGAGKFYLRISNEI